MWAWVRADRWRGEQEWKVGWRKSWRSSTVHRQNEKWTTWRSLSSGAVCLDSNLVCCSFCFAFGGGRCSHIQRVWHVLQRDRRWTPGLYFTAGGTRACKTSTLTVYFDPNVTKINLILAQPWGVWIGLHQGSKIKKKKIRPLLTGSRVLVSDFRVPSSSST